VLEIIPAIDLLGGQAVRLRKGDYATGEKVAEDPIAVARSFEAQGARRLHIVDLDGARTGDPINAAIVRAVVEAVAIPVQVGGGVRTVARAAELIGWGVARVIVGTSAAQNPAVIGAMLSEFPENVIVGADTADGFVAVHGWQESSGERAADFGRRLIALGARRFLFTDVARDGMLQGVNIAATRAFADAVGVPVLASGGVSGPDDITALAAASSESGIEGVIVGKALYAGRLTLADALQIAAQGRG
jgi:phosphoribosylformimino-5-aminoimidazole carboxamide ribotide isomerase